MIPKKLYTIKLTEADIKNKTQERLELLDAVSDLEKKHNNLNSSLEQSLKNKDNNEELMQNVIKLDKENAELRSRISILQERLNTSR